MSSGSQKMAPIWGELTDRCPYHGFTASSGRFPLSRQGKQTGEGAVRHVGGSDRRLPGHFLASGETAREIGERVGAGVLSYIRIPAMRRVLRNEQNERPKPTPHEISRKRFGPGRLRPQNTMRIAKREDSHSPLFKLIAVQRVTPKRKCLFDNARPPGWKGKIRHSHNLSNVIQPPERSAILLLGKHAKPSGAASNKLSSGTEQKLGQGTHGSSTFAAAAASASSDPLPVFTLCDSLLGGSSARHCLGSAGRSCHSNTQFGNGASISFRISCGVTFGDCPGGSSAFVLQYSNIVRVVRCHFAPSVCILFVISFGNFICILFYIRIGNGVGISFRFSYVIALGGCSCGGGAFGLQYSNIIRVWRCHFAPPVCILFGVSFGNLICIRFYIRPLVGTEDSSVFHCTDPALSWQLGFELKRHRKMADLASVFANLHLLNKEKLKLESIRKGEAAGTGLDKARQEAARSASAKKIQQKEAAAAAATKTALLTATMTEQATQSMVALQKQHESPHPETRIYSLEEGRLKLAPGRINLIQICLTESGKTIPLQEAFAIAHLTLGGKALSSEHLQHGARINRSLGKEWSQESCHVRIDQIAGDGKRSQATGAQIQKELESRGMTFLTALLSNAPPWKIPPSSPVDNKTTQGRFKAEIATGFSAQASFTGAAKAWMRVSDKVEIDGELWQVTPLPHPKAGCSIELSFEETERPKLKRLVWFFSTLGFSTTDLEGFLEACILENKHLQHMRESISCVRIDRARKNKEVWMSLNYEALGSKNIKLGRGEWSQVGVPRILVILKDKAIADEIVAEAKAILLFLGTSAEQSPLAVRAIPFRTDSSTANAAVNIAADSHFRTEIEKSLELPRLLVRQWQQLIIDLENEYLDDDEAALNCRTMHQRLEGLRVELGERPSVYKFFEPFVISALDILQPDPASSALWEKQSDMLQDLSTALQDGYDASYLILRIFPSERWPPQDSLFGEKIHRSLLPRMLGRIMAGQGIETLAISLIQPQEGGRAKTGAWAWDQVRGAIQVAIPRTSETLLRELMVGDKLKLRSLNQTVECEVVVKWPTAEQLTRNSEDDEKWLCEEITKIFDRGTLLHCPKFVDGTPENGRGTTWDTKLSDFTKSDDMKEGDVRLIKSLIPDCSEQIIESTMQCIGRLVSRNKIRAPWGADLDKNVYISEDIANLLPDNFVWNGILERPGAVLDTTDSIFGQAVDAELVKGLWTTADMAGTTGRHLDDAADSIGAEGDAANHENRCWLEVLREHPYARLASGMHGFRVLCGLRDQHILLIIKKQGRSLVIPAKSPFLDCILEAGTGSGVIANDVIRYDDFKLPPKMISEFAELLAQEMTKHGGFALVKQPPGLGVLTILECQMIDQVGRVDKRILPQISPDIRFSQSKLAFLAINLLAQNNHAKVEKLTDGFGVIIASWLQNARPLHLFTIEEEFGDQLDKLFLERSFTSGFAKVVPTTQSLDIARRAQLFIKMEEVFQGPFILREWKIETQHDARSTLIAGERPTSQTLEDGRLDAEIRIRHPGYYTRDGAEIISDMIESENARAFQLACGVLILTYGLGANNWSQEDSRIQKWDPFENTLDTLLQQESTASGEVPMECGSAMSSTDATAGEMMCVEVSTCAGAEAGAGAALDTAGDGETAVAETGAGAGSGGGAGTNVGTRATEKRTAWYRDGLSEQCTQVKIRHISASSEREGYEITKTQTRNSGNGDVPGWVPEKGDSEPTVTMTLQSEETISLLLYAGMPSGNKFHRVILRCEDEKEQTVTLDASSELRVYKFQPISTSTMKLTFQTDTPHEGEAGAQVIELWSDPAAGMVLKKTKRGNPQNK